MSDLNPQLFEVECHARVKRLGNCQTYAAELLRQSGTDGRGGLTLYTIHLHSILSLPHHTPQDTPQYLLLASQPIRRTPHPQPPAIQHVRVDHRRAHVRMPQQFL